MIGRWPAALLLLLWIPMAAGFAWPRSRPWRGTVRVLLRRGDTLWSALGRAGLSAQQRREVLHILATDPCLGRFRRWRPGDRLRVIMDEQGKVVKVIARHGGRRKALEATPRPGRERPPEEGWERFLVRMRGRITRGSSLYQAICRSGGSARLAHAFTEIFPRVDFSRDCHPGDRFSLLTEVCYDSRGRPRNFGTILAAEYHTRGRTLRAFRFEGRYYNSHGEPLQEAFLRWPLRFTRISSRYSFHRFHPILHRWLPHLGVDLAAPYGTPVWSIGEGRVIFRGWRWGFGRQVIIRHPGGYITYYGHLSRFARGLRKGMWVHKGQIIGYVGTSGLATGPHLDFRVKHRGRFVNPITVRYPRVRPLPPSRRAAFFRTRDTLWSLLQGEEFYPLAARERG